jgi:hypothetical protein
VLGDTERDPVKVPAAPATVSGIAGIVAPTTLPMAVILVLYTPPGGIPVTGLNCSVIAQVFDVLGGAGTVVQPLEITVKF